MHQRARLWWAAPFVLLFTACVPTPEGDLGTANDKVGGVDVEGINACSFTQGAWGSACHGQNVGCVRDAWFPEVFGQGLTVGQVVPHVLATAADVEAYLPQGGPASHGAHSTFYGQMTALKLNLAFSAAGAFGAAKDLGNATMKGGAYDGWTATALLAYAESVPPAQAQSALISALTAFNEAFDTCDPANLPPQDTDVDGDGVPGSADCDDHNPLIGALLYKNNMSVDNGYFAVGPTLTDPWVYGGGHVSNTDGGQQAFLGQEEAWGDTVTFVVLSAHGSKSGCSSDAPDCNPERFRAGVLARTTIDPDQDEGFHGYRCAVAVNATTDCYEPGPFVQLAAFLNEAEDDVKSECTQGCPPNPTFDQLARTNRSGLTDVLAGDTALLTFWAVGTDLLCAFDGVGGEHVVAAAADERFSTGRTGFSTLNALGEFDQISVCQAFGVPAH